MNATLWVKESAFGIWFLGTDIWLNRVLKRALADLVILLPDRQYRYAAILDIGCGRGKSFDLLDHYFNPDGITGLEIDASLFTGALDSADRCRCQVHLIGGNAEKLPFSDRSFDMVFCHQSFHHIIQQEQTIKEFYRVLKPGGALLFAESCKRFIHSLPIRLLFRHPMTVQKTAEEYLTLIKKNGFQVKPQSVSKPYLWWSRPDIGALEWFGFKVPEQREETLLNVVAIKQS